MLGSVRSPGRRRRRCWKSVRGSVCCILLGRLFDQLYLDAVKGDGSVDFPGKDCGVHVVKFESVSVACAEVAAERRQLIVEMGVEFAIDVVRRWPDTLLEDFRKAPAKQGVCVVLHRPGIALEDRAKRSNQRAKLEAVTQEQKRHSRVGHIKT
jgi:hypothetical protein